LAILVRGHSLVVGQNARESLNSASPQSSGIGKPASDLDHLNPMFPQLARFTDLALLLMRILVGLVFVTSGYGHLKNLEARAKSIGMSKPFTAFLGVAELSGGLGVAFGVLTQLAAFGLILIMFGAIQKKMFVWHTGFWGEKASGWHYDLLFVIMNLVIACTNGGRYVLMR
jgi:putative oxidoreductase